MAGIGNPKAIEAPEILWDYFVQYRQWVKDNPIEIEDYVGKDAERVMRQKPRPLTIEGFENHCHREFGIVTLQQYFENREERYTNYVSICRTIRMEIRQNQIEGGMAGIFNPSITQRLNNLKEATDITTNGKDVQSNIIVQDAQTKENLDKIK